MEHFNWKEFVYMLLKNGVTDSSASISQLIKRDFNTVVKPQSIAALKANFNR